MHFCSGQKCTTTSQADTCFQHWMNNGREQRVGDPEACIASQKDCKLQYCNEHPDLKDGYCGGNTCSTDSQADTCYSHWVNDGIGERERNFNPDNCKNGRPCPAGKWSDVNGIASDTECSLCSMGKWSSQTGLVSESQCKFCPIGKSSSQLGLNCCHRMHTKRVHLREWHRSHRR